MLELLQTYSVSQILVFIVILALAIKGVVSFLDWGVERLRKIFSKETQSEKEKEAIDLRFEKDELKIDSIIETQQKTNEVLEKMSDKIDTLIDSDKDDIKSFITREHHYYCYEKKWIDDFTMDCIEKRYGHYKKEGGNSFAHDLMMELRALPKQPPQ